MELIDVLRGRWLALAIAAPILAGVIALTLLSMQADQRYVASATVSVPQAIALSPTDQAVRTVLEDFSNAFTSRNVASRVADITGRSEESLLASLSASPVGSGGDVFVSLDGQSSEAVETQLREVSRAALMVIAQSSADQAGVRVEAADRQLEATLAQLAEIEEEAGTTDLLNEYRQLSTLVQSLRNDIALELDSAARRAAMESLLAERLTELDDLRSLVTEWELRRNELTQASAARDQAERDELGAETVLDRVSSNALSLRVDVSGSSGVSQATLPTLVAMVAALGGVVLLAINSRRNQLVRAADDPEPLVEPDELDDSDAPPTPTDDEVFRVEKYPQRVEKYPQREPTR